MDCQSYTDDHNEMISFGAGVNSVAMTIMLVNDGWRGPIVFADPGSERPETYCYLNYFEREYLAPRNQHIIKIDPDSPYHERSELPLYDFCMDKAIIPYMGTKWCSLEWKVKPLDNWALANGVTTKMIGFTIEEESRVKNYPGSVFPLVEQDITRPECHRIIARAGLDSPIKSGCFFCPGQPLASWQDLYLNHPDLYEQSMALEENASLKRGKTITLDAHGTTLREHRERRWVGQQQFDLSVWMHCMCRL